MLGPSAKSLKSRLEKLELKARRIKIKVQTWPTTLDIEKWELEAVASQEKLVLDTRNDCPT